jgi:N-acetylmuramic acid 6-phosphate etherase
VIPPTEQPHPSSRHLGSCSPAEVIALMNADEQRAFDAVVAASPAIARAAQVVADVYGAGGRVAYLATGTSGLLCAQDAAELPATFGVDSTRYLALVTAASTTTSLRGRSEDDTDAAGNALDELAFGASDAVIGVAASGSTPLVLGGMRRARANGCRTVGMANNPATPLLTDVDVPVLLDTGPEVLTGSTRLKAGTAQKLALNRISTAAMVQLGHVVGNAMVDLAPANDKLRERSVRIVSELAAVSPAEARERLLACSWSIRAAVGDTKT